MKRCSSAAVLVLVVGVFAADRSALAQAAPNFELRKTVCPAVAQQAGMAYTAKHENGTSFQLTQELLSSPMRSLYQWATDYALKQATGIDNAVTTAVEKCLRNVDMVDRNARMGKWTKVEELQ